eukprot:13112676-Alexandrium_andersonii.AAC.1
MPAGYMRTTRPRSTLVSLLRFFGAAAAFADSGSTRASPRMECRRCVGPLPSRRRRACVAGRRVGRSATKRRAGA